MTLNIRADWWKIEPSFTPDGIGNCLAINMENPQKSKNTKSTICIYTTSWYVTQNLISLVSNIIFTIAKKWKPKMSFNQ